MISSGLIACYGQNIVACHESVPPSRQSVSVKRQWRLAYTRVLVKVLDRAASCSLPQHWVKI